MLAVAIVTAALIRDVRRRRWSLISVAAVGTFALCVVGVIIFDALAG